MAAAVLSTFGMQHGLSSLPRPLKQGHHGFSKISRVWDLSNQLRAALPWNLPQKLLATVKHVLQHMLQHPGPTATGAATIVCRGAIVGCKNIFVPSWFFWTDAARMHCPNAGRTGERERGEQSHVQIIMLDG